VTDNLHGQENAQSDPSMMETDPLPPEDRKLLQNLASDDPQKALDHIREKMESVAEEFAQGRLNRAQFNAIYGHYGEQRSIIELLTERNPDTDAWKQVARPGRTTFLRSHFEARPTYYIIFRHRIQKPLYHDGEHPNDNIKHIVGGLRQLWSLKEIPNKGLARKEIDANKWMVMAVGQYSTTIVVFSLQPSNAQTALVNDSHRDFERANRISLQRGVTSDRLVFPQKALLSQ